MLDAQVLRFARARFVKQARKDDADFDLFRVRATVPALRV
jgi:hypothetical protein